MWTLFLAYKNSEVYLALGILGKVEDIGTDS